MKKLKYSYENDNNNVDFFNAFEEIMQNTTNDYITVTQEDLNFINNIVIKERRKKRIKKEKKIQNLKGNVVYNNDECRVLEYHSDYLKVYNLNKNRTENILRSQLQ